MKFGRYLLIIVPNEYYFARICNCCRDQDIFKMAFCGHFKLYCFIHKICIVHNEKIKIWTYIHNEVRSAIGVFLSRSEVDTIFKIFKMASSGDLWLFLNKTLNVIIQRQNLTQSFTEEVHLYQDLQLVHDQYIWDINRQISWISSIIVFSWQLIYQKWNFA